MNLRSVHVTGQQSCDRHLVTIGSYTDDTQLSAWVTTADAIAIAAAWTEAAAQLAAFDQADLEDLTYQTQAS